MKKRTSLLTITDPLRSKVGWMMLEAPSHRSHRPLSHFKDSVDATTILTQGGREKVHERRAPTTHLATAPNQVWCWDITWIPSSVRGQFFYWYMVKDVFSRKVVASEVHIAESSALAAELLKRGTLKERVFEVSLILHSDNGSAMKGSTMLATMQNLGVVPSFSRPRVSNDNAYAETLFRTAKYCPLWPSKPFESLEKARKWVATFVIWYNEEHRQWTFCDAR